MQPTSQSSSRGRRRGPWRRRRLWLLGAAVIAVLAGPAAFLGPAGALNLVVPRTGYDLSTSVAYGDGPRRTLDVYAPKDARDAPVIVFFYGGSWQMGRKEIYRFLGAQFARRGYVTVIPDYRVYP